MDSDKDGIWVVRLILIVLMAIWSPTRAFSEEHLNLKPLVLYSTGGLMDIWSTRGLPAFRDRSPAGPVAGPIGAALCFTGADLLLQRSHHPRGSKLLRAAYVVGITAVVMHNRSYK